jgi:hypothetical protein
MKAFHNLKQTQRSKISLICGCFFHVLGFVSHSIRISNLGMVLGFCARRPASGSTVGMGKCNPNSVIERKMSPARFSRLNETLFELKKGHAVVCYAGSPLYRKRATDDR